MKKSNKDDMKYTSFGYEKLLNRTNSQQSVVTGKHRVAHTVTETEIVKMGKEGTNFNTIKCIYRMSFFGSYTKRNIGNIYDEYAC